MRVAIVAERVGERGAGISALRLAHALQDAGQEVRYFGAHQPAEGSDVDVEVFASWHQRYTDLRAAKRSADPRARADLIVKAHRAKGDAYGALAAGLRRFAPDIVNVHNVGAVLRHTDVVRVAAEWPVVWTAHDQHPFRLFHNEWVDGGDTHRVWEESTGRWPSDAALEAVIALGPRWSWITPSSWLANIAGSTFPGTNIRIIPNLVPDHGAAPPTFEPLRSTLDADFVGVASIIDTTYGLKNFAAAREAMLETRARLSHRSDEWRVALVVTTTERLDLDGMGVYTLADLSARGLLDTNRLLSPPEFFALLSASDFMLLPSLAENLPNAAIEALQAGVPSVLANVGGVGDVVGDSDAGILVEPRDPVAIGSTLAALLADEDRRRAMGKAGRERWLERFAPPVVLKAYLRAFAEQINIFAR